LLIPLKLAAIRAGLGWQGKHSLLISKTYGTFLALGGITTNADLEHNTLEESNGNIRRLKGCALSQAPDYSFKRLK
jgi:epoxyqueuosine reductase